MSNWYKITAQKIGEDWDESPDASSYCPYCHGTGSVSSGPNSPRPTRCEDCMGTGVKPKFEIGDDVVIDTRETGMIDGTVSELSEFNNGEWYYKVDIDDLQDTFTIPESQMQ